MSERRSFFRIDQELLLEVKSVDAYTADHGEADAQFSDPLPLQLFAKFNELDQQAAELSHSIGEHQAITQYLGLMNKKINLLARELIAQQPSPSGQKPTKVNLSEAGIGFLAEKAYYKDSYLVMRLIFLPTYAGVVLFAKVVRSDKASRNSESKGDLFHIAAKFHRLTAANQHMLAKHIMEQQLANQRRAKTTQP